MIFETITTLIWTLVFKFRKTKRKKCSSSIKGLGGGGGGGGGSTSGSESEIRVEYIKWGNSCVELMGPSISRLRWTMGHPLITIYMVTLSTALEIPHSLSYPLSARLFFSSSLLFFPPFSIPFPFYLYDAFIRDLYSSWDDASVRFFESNVSALESWW